MEEMLVPDSWYTGTCSFCGQTILVVLSRNAPVGGYNCECSDLRGYPWTNVPEGTLAVLAKEIPL